VIDDADERIRSHADLADSAMIMAELCGYHPT
jgi:hypothetical protein